MRCHDLAQTVFWWGVAHWVTRGFSMNSLRRWKDQRQLLRQHLKSASVWHVNTHGFTRCVIASADSSSYANIFPGILKKNLRSNFRGWILKIYDQNLCA